MIRFHRGARAVNLDHLIGNFEVGKIFDAQLISLGHEDSQVDLFLDQRQNKMLFHELVERWVYNGQPIDRKEVYCAGVQIRRR